MQSADEGASERVLSQAERLFADFVEQHGEGDREAFDRLCAAHPGHAGELRAFAADLARVSGLLEEVGREPDRATRSTPSSREGEPEISVAEGGGLAESEPGGLLARLWKSREHSRRYEVQGEIARGGMGTVLSVWDRDLRRKLAMKLRRYADLTGGTPSPASPAEERLLSRFLVEAQVTAQLEHPNIVPVHDLGVDDAGRIYFTMPLVRGEEFRVVIEHARAARSGWDLRRAVGVLVKVCEAVAFAHDRGVVHRDLKPSNIMVGRFGETYVMDWGLALVRGRADLLELDKATSEAVSTDREERRRASPDSPLVTRHGEVLGTPAYMAPEQARGEQDRVGSPADVYSIGAMLYHLLTGVVPYSRSANSRSQMQVMVELRAGPPPRIEALDPGVDPDLARICEKAMAREPEARYAGALELGRDLENYLFRRPVSAADSSALHAVALFVERHQSAVVTAVAGLVLLFVVGGAAWWRTARAAERERDARILGEISRDTLLASELVDRRSDYYVDLPQRRASLGAWTLRAEKVLARKAELLDHARANPEEPGSRRIADDCARLEHDLPEVREDLAAVLGLEQHFVSPAWKDCSLAVAQSPAYEGLELVPQWGLVPLHEHSVSGLWLFWAPLTGNEPRYSAESPDLIEADPDMAMVFALMPPGSFELGLTPAQLATVFGPQVGTPRAQVEVRRPAHFEPFFLSIFETTRAQWQRVMRFDPSLGADHPLLPVSFVDALEADEFARRCGLRLPSGDEWEYAARAYHHGIYGSGDGVEALRGENVRDQGWGAATGFEAVPWNDGYKLATRVGASGGGNAFGLCDMLGNVSEWVSDPGFREGERLTRGASFHTTVTQARCSAVNSRHAKARSEETGVRLCLSLALE